MKKRIVYGLLAILIIIMLVFCLKPNLNEKTKTYSMYLGSKTKEVTLYNEKYIEVKKVPRGTKVEVYENKIIDSNTKQEYKKILLDKNDYYVFIDHIVEKEEQTVFETEKYVRTMATIYQNEKGSEILGLAKKGEILQIIGFDYLESGVANKYKVVYNDLEGFVYSKYLVDTKKEADQHYDEENSYLIHLERKNTLGGGDAGSLDFYPYEKGKFEKNKMPEEVRSLYLNAGVIKNIDAYIKLAKESNINAFVVDVKDNTAPAYQSKVMEKYSKTNYEHAINSFDEYKKAIQKLKQNGFYTIGRITTFKDSYYVTDHPESAIADSVTGNPYEHNGSYWPSAYDRKVWEFNLELAKEAVIEMGFQEIQFDYIRFPDRTNQLEKDGKIDMKNIYNETKAQAIQAYLMYVCDSLHELGVYVSADVFGESAHHYVTAYGQYWGAISNIVDVISAMPYPDHFGAYEYGMKEISWTVPYTLLSIWGKDYVKNRQNEIPTPAIVRTWIQAYDTVRSPYIVYDSTKILDQIKALKDAGLLGGYMTWNASSNLEKYKQIAPAFEREY